MTRKPARNKRHITQSDQREPAARTNWALQGPIPPRPGPAGLGLAIVWEIPDQAPATVKEALIRRRIVAVGGRCPCGAGLNRAQRRAGGSIISQDITHADGCPVLSAEVDQYIRSHALRELAITFPLRRGA